MVTEWCLLAIWVIDALMVMSEIPGGLFTSYAADLTIPAWLYVVMRRSTQRGLFGWRDRLSRSQLLLATTIFAGSAFTEIAQYLSPRGPFPGVFDPLDIVAYASGVGICAAVDRRWPIRGTRKSAASEAAP